jgi:hypothetical protein
VIGRGPESGYVAFCVRYEGSCLTIYVVFGYCYYMCILLLPVQISWLLFIFYLIGCAIELIGPYGEVGLEFWGGRKLLLFSRAT